MKYFELLSHTADLKMHVWGATLQELFEHAIFSMFTVLKPELKYQDCQKADLKRVRAVNIVAPDVTTLLIDFLSEVLYLSDVHDEAYFQVTFQECTETVIHVYLTGIPIIRFRHAEIKAVTWHETEVTKTLSGWQAIIVFDI